MCYNYSNIIYLLCKLETKMTATKIKGWIFYLSLSILLNIVIFQYFKDWSLRTILVICSSFISLILTECVEIILNLNNKNNGKL